MEQFADGHDVFEYIKQQLDEYDEDTIIEIYKRVLGDGLTDTLRYQIMEDYVGYKHDELDKIKTEEQADKFINKYLFGE